MAAKQSIDLNSVDYRIWELIQKRVYKSLVHAFATSRIDYCNSVIYGARAAHIQPLLNAAARLILHKRKYDHTTSDIRDRLHWLPIQQRLKYKISVC